MKPRIIYLSLFIAVLAPMVAIAADADDSSNYTTEYSYTHGIKTDPSDKTADSLNSRQAELYKPVEREVTTTTIIHHSEGGSCHADKSGQ